MRRITVVSHDRHGLVADLTELLSRNGLNLISIDAHSVGQDAVLRLEVDEEERALSALTQAGYQTVTEDVLTVTMPDQPGALARIARRLAEARLNIRGVSFISRRGATCILAIDTDDNARARTVLADLAL